MKHTLVGQNDDAVSFIKLVKFILVEKDGGEPRRKSTRAYSSFPLTITCTAENNKTKTESVFLCDISETGLSFISKRPYAPNQIIEAAIEHDRQHYEVSARIVYSTLVADFYRTGVEFIPAGDETI